MRLPLMSPCKIRGPPPCSYLAPHSILKYVRPGGFHCKLVLVERACLIRLAFSCLCSISPLMLLRDRRSLGKKKMGRTEVRKSRRSAK